MIVYCKEDYCYRSGYIIEYHKYKTYHIDDSVTSDRQHEIFVRLAPNSTGDGLWFKKDIFNIHFTTDKSFMRELKLERICNET